MSIIQPMTFCIEWLSHETRPFLAEVGRTDWQEVYSCSEVDMATEVFSRKFRNVLNVHAPWVRVQQRKAFCPWITQETKEMMKQRDIWKERAKSLAVLSEGDACQAQIDAWRQYKLYRNKINNRKKYEEQNFKRNKIAEVADSPNIVWKAAKNYMGWRNNGTPSQLKVGNELMTSARKKLK